MYVHQNLSGDNKNLRKLKNENLKMFNSRPSIYHEFDLFGSLDYKIYPGEF